MEKGPRVQRYAVLSVSLGPVLGTLRDLNLPSPFNHPSMPSRSVTFSSSRVGAPTSDGGGRDQGARKNR